MRLLDTTHDHLRLIEVEGSFTKEYAILSHTWGSDEIVFADIEKNDNNHMSLESKAGYRKLSYALAQARNDGYDYLWADMCCIDKPSVADLSEAINSMFYFYEQAVVCYVYLSDVQSRQDLRSSRWFTRGWTLQELLAPKTVLFFSSSWQMIGDKLSLQPLITEITGISRRVLLKEVKITSQSVARRMSWASCRETTRIEDNAYCLLGIFGISMPLLYGEKGNAFIRLQKEITKVTDDQSLFAWVDLGASYDKMYGLLAESPRFFADSAHYVPCIDPESEEPYSMINKRLKVEVRFTDRAEKQAGHKLPFRKAMLSCADIRQANQYISIILTSFSASRNEYCRIYCSTLGSDIYLPILSSIYVPQPRSNYYARDALRPNDYIINVAAEKTMLFTGVEFVGCTYRTKPDLQEHGIGPYAGTYPKCLGDETPRQFIGESYSDRMAVALHYILRIGIFRNPLTMTVLFGMTTDLKFGWNAVPYAANLSLEELQNRFLPEIHSEIVLTYNNTDIKAKGKVDVTRTTQNTSKGHHLVRYDIKVKLGYSVS